MKTNCTPSASWKIKVTISGGEDKPLVSCTWYGHLYFSGCTKRGVCLHHLIWSPLFIRMHETWGLSSPPDMVTFIFQDARNVGFVFTTWYGHLYFSGCTKRGFVFTTWSWSPLFFRMHETFIFQDARGVQFVFTTWYGASWKIKDAPYRGGEDFTTWYGHLYFSGCTKRGVCLHHLIWSPLFFRMHQTRGLSSPPDMVTFIFQDARGVEFVFTTWYGHLYFSGCTKRGVCLRHLKWWPLFFRMHETWGLSSPPDMVTFIFQDARNEGFVFTTWYGHLYFSGCTKRGVCLHHLIWSPLFFRMHETRGLSSPPDMVTFIFQDALGVTWYGHLYFSGCTKRGVCLHHLIWSPLFFRMHDIVVVCLHHLIWSPLFFRMHETWGLSSPPDMVTFIFQDARNVGFVFTTWYGHLYFSGCTKRGVCLHHLIWSPLFFKMHPSPPEKWKGCLHHLIWSPLFFRMHERGVCLHHLIWSPLFFRMHETRGLSHHLIWSPLFFRMH